MLFFGHREDPVGIDLNGQSHRTTAVEAHRQLDDHRGEHGAREQVVGELGRERIEWLIAQGVPFTTRTSKSGAVEVHLTREGGHSHRRIVHVADATGWAVQEALLGVMQFWLDRGVDGFRIDALNFLMHDPALRNNPPAPYDGRRRTRP